MQDGKEDLINSKNPFHKNLCQTEKVTRPRGICNPFGHEGNEDEDMLLPVDEGSSSGISRMSDSNQMLSVNNMSGSLQNTQGLKQKELSSTIGSGQQNGRISIINTQNNGINRRSEIIQQTPAEKYFQRAQEDLNSNSNEENIEQRIHFEELNSSGFSQANQQAFDHVQVNEQFGAKENGPNNPLKSESDRSSKLFEVASSQNLQGKSTIQKIKSIKDLMRLFRVNINEEMTFEYNGQVYLLDLEELKQVSQFQQMNRLESNDLFNTRQVSAFFPGNNNFEKSPEGNFNDRVSSRETFGFGNILEKVQKPQKIVFPVLNSRDMTQEELDDEILNNQSPQNQQPTKDKETQCPESDLVENSNNLTQTNSLQSSQLQLGERTKSNKSAFIQYNLQEVQANAARDIEIEENLGLQIPQLPQMNTAAKSVNLQYQDSMNFSDQKKMFKNSIANTKTNSFKSNINALGRMKSEMNVPLSPMLRRIVSMNDSGSFNQRLDQFQQDELLYQNQQLQKENQQLKESLQKQIKKPPHLVFLFATPLVVFKGSPALNLPFKDKYKPQPLLEFKREFKEIKESIKESQNQIRVCSQQATVENFTKVLGQKPMALHFTGHGLQYTTPGGTIKKLLMLEHYDGVSEELTEEQLAKTIKSTNAQLDFVFVASCNSEFAGRVFQNIGAKHVIVVKQGNNIADEAVILFSKTFYYLVFQGTHTVCESFHSAKTAVEARFGINESNKFTILKATDLLISKQKEEAAKLSVNEKAQIKSDIPKDKKKKKKNKFGLNNISDDEEFAVELDPGLFGIQPIAPPKKQQTEKQQVGIEQKPNNIQKIEEIVHECVIFGPFQQGSLESQDEQPFFREIPSYVENFIGRQVELFEVIHNLMKNRLVNIVGLPGIGKTALAKNAVHYMYDRRIFKLGIIFFSLKGYKNCDVFMKKLVSNIMINNLDLKPEEVASINEGNKDTLKQMIINKFKDEEDQLLVVFDNAEELIYYDKKDFRDLVTDLLNRCPGLKFLLTSRAYLGSLEGLHEQIVVLQELEPLYAYKLFISRARTIEDDEKLELIQYKPIDKLLVGEDLHSKDSEMNLSKHHLFKILAGNPHAIILAAPLLLKSKTTLKDLYILLNSDQVTQSLAVDGVKDSTVASLILSIEASVIMLQKEDDEALQFFYMIGLLPGGIFKKELEDIWKRQSQVEKNYEEHVKTLLNMSLLQHKDQAGDNQEQSKFILPPFINNYAEQTIDPALKTRFQTTLCTYYAKILQDIFREDFRQWIREHGNNNKQEGGGGDQSPRPEVTPDYMQHEQAFIKQQRQQMIRHETNIWACIYRMSKTDLPIQLDQLDIEQIDKSKKNQTRRSSVQTSKNKVKPQFQIVRHRKSSNSEELLDNISQISKLDPEAKSKSFNDFSYILPGKAGPKLLRVESVEEDNLVSDDRSSNKNKPKKTQMMPSIPEEDKQSAYSCDRSNNYQSSSCKEDEFDHDFEQLDANDIDEAPQVDKKSSNLFLKLKNSFKDSVKVKEIRKIVRDSIVTFAFRRSSTIMKNPTFGLAPTVSENVQIKELLNDDVYLPVPSKSYSDALPFFNGLGPVQSTPDSYRNIQYMTEPEKLIVYYGMILYLHKDDDNALKLLSRFAKDIKGSFLYEANIQRILGLIYLRKVDVSEAISAFKQAESLYKLGHSNYGHALSHFSIGVTYQSKLSSFIESPKKGGAVSSPENTQLMKALKNFEEALKLFKYPLNHKIGQARCHEHLASIYAELNDTEKSNFHARQKVQLHGEYTKYLEKSRKHCPHVHRQYGQDISLMTEIVKDSDNRDMFPEVSQCPTTPTSSSSKLKLDRVFSNQPSLNDPLKHLPLVHQISEPDFKMYPFLQGTILKQQSKSPINHYNPFGFGDSNDLSSPFDDDLDRKILDFHPQSDPQPSYQPQRTVTIPQDLAVVSEEDNETDIQDIHISIARNLTPPKKHLHQSLTPKVVQEERPRGSNIQKFLSVFTRAGSQQQIFKSPVPMVEDKLSPIGNKEMSESAPKKGFGKLFQKIGEMAQKNPRERKSTL